MPHSPGGVERSARTFVSGASGTGVDSQNPLYQEFLDDWITMRDVYRGQRVVKAEGQRYLPPTAGMQADGMANKEQEGFKAYEAYKARALFPDVVDAAVEAMIGVMHNKPAIIEVPAAMEPMLESITVHHESAQMLLRRINEEQLVTGRLGLLLDLAETETTDVSVLPYIAMYKAEHVINWDEGRRDGLVVDSLNFVSINESEFERVRNFEWEFVRKFRVLTLGEVQENEPSHEGHVYKAGVFREMSTHLPSGEQGKTLDSSFSEDAMVTPSIRGKKLDKIPFVFINAKDVVPTPEDPPLIGLANLALAIYRAEADYRQALFMQGQDTLVVIDGGEEDYRAGANAAIKLSGPTADAKYIGVSATGLPEMRNSLENDKRLAATKGGEMVDTVSREKESGDALKIRVAARTSTLNQVALAGAFGLEQILKCAAEWLGLNPEDVTVTPNLDFVDDALEGKTLVEWATAKAMGLPFSWLSIHEQMEERDLTTLTFEEEVAQIEKEADAGIGMPTGGLEEDEEDEDEEDEEDDPPKDPDEDE